MNELWKLFKSHDLDVQELTAIVATHFNSHSQTAPNEVTYPGDKPYAIKLVYSDENGLKAIEYGPAVTTELRQGIEASIRESLLTPPTEQIWCGVLFANQPLTGSWRCRDLFQIVPIPEGAPKVKGLMGNHPFIVEVIVDSSPNQRITQLRFHRRLREIECLLAGLVQGSIHHIVQGLNWVYATDDPASPQQRWSGYHSNSIPTRLEEFSEGHQNARVLSAMELFSPTGIHMGAPLTVPDTLGESLDSYQSLLPSQQRRFLRACYWIVRANQAMSRLEHSVAFIAVVVSIETLFESSPDECSCCHQAVYKLSNNFVDWLNHYAPLDEIVMRTSAEKDPIRDRLRDLYSRRSDITHGRSLLVHDSQSDYGMTPLGNLQSSDLRALLQIMPVALANWLSDPQTPAPHDE